MNNKLAKEYTGRIVQASATELIVIIYELIIKEIELAKEEFEDGNQEGFVRSLKSGQLFISHLMESLDYQYKMSYDLLGLYLYVNRNIVNAICKLNPKELKNSESIINKLKFGFEAIKDEDKSGPVMANAQQVYAGLTYGKGKLNEVNVDPKDFNRGYKA